MRVQRVRPAADAGFWPAAAAAVVEFAIRTGLPERQLQRLTWLVPGALQAALARAALRAAFAGVAYIPPRIETLADWLRGPLASGTTARAELFSALRGNAWIRESFGAQPGTLWALARGIATLCDELTWAAVDSPDAFAGRLHASLARCYQRRAARALQPQAQLVLQLWRARREADDGPARALRELERRAVAARAPLVYVTSGLGAMPGESALARWEDMFVERHAQAAPVLVIEPDLAAALGGHPLLVAAWPELAGADARTPLAQRADAIAAAAGQARLPLGIVRAVTLEDEAMAIAHQVLDWLSEGVGSIALVALDRLTARRVRALLERAQVRVRDETGWRLSTTSAAAAVMRWYDLVSDDLYWRDLLDWLKSTFTLGGRSSKTREVAAVERSIRSSGALRGARAMRRALADLRAAAMEDAAAGVDACDCDGADRILALIEAQCQAMRRAAPTLAGHAHALQNALDALGMREALAADTVGAAVLREIDALQVETATVDGRATLADFRALLAARFEEVSFVDRQVESPVVMLPLAAAVLRVFDAALLIGADEHHLPSVPSDGSFMSNAVRSELGLATADRELREQAAQLAALLASTPRVLATWRARRGEEPNALSPLLARLQFVARRALGDDLLREVAHETAAVEPVAATRPAPSAGSLLPRRLSASHAQSLVDCAYQFYARRLLGLAELDDVIEMPDKRDFGEALHGVLRRFHAAWGAADFSALGAQELGASLRDHAQAVFGPRLERAPGLLAFQRRFDGLVEGYVEWLQRHAADGWRWDAGEQSHIRPLALTDDNEIELAGRVDRIDRDGGSRMLLIDYKARNAAALKAGLKQRGEDIQLPFYGLLLARRAQDAGYLGFDRAKEGEGGVEYIGVEQDFAALMDAVETRLRADLQRICDGAPLPAIGAATVCERCEMRGLCRRDYWEAGPAVDAADGR